MVAGISLLKENTMGYRNYLGRMPKDVYDGVRDLSERDLKDLFGCPQDDYFNPRKHIQLEELHELGKYCEFPGIDMVKKPLFDKAMSWDTDEEYYVGGKSLIEYFIENYRESVHTYYEELFSSMDDNLNEVKFFFERRIDDWEGKYTKPYNLNTDSSAIVSSWLYEYAVFELVRIYKSFDYDNYVVTYTGH